LEKEGKQGGFWSKGHLLPPFTVQNRERGDWAAAGLEEGAPAALPIAAAGKRLKMERRQRGFYSRAHLELAQRREVDRREGSGAAVMLGGRQRCGARGKGEGCCEAGGGEVRRHGGQPTPFIGGGRWFGGGEIFPASSTPASSSGFSRRRPVTRRLGQRWQVNSCRSGAARAAVERGRRLAVVLGGDRTAGE
jgi:hypothetical protein